MRPPSLTHLSVPTVRARSASDVVAVMPHLLGYRPRESVVVACITEDSTIGLLARVDLDDLTGPVARRDGPGRPGAASGPGPVEHVAAAARRAGTRFAVLAVHTDRDPVAARAAVEPLRVALERGCDVEGWRVGPRGYGGIDCDDAACCPPGGRPLSDLENRAVNAELVVAGFAVADSPDQAFRIPPAPSAARARAARAAIRAAGSAASGDASPDPGSAHGEPSVHTLAQRAARRRTAGYDLWRELVRHAARDVTLEAPAAADLPPARLGRLAAALADVSVRDAVLLSLVPGGEGVARMTAEGVGRAAAEDGVDGGVDGGVEVATARAIARVVDPRVAVRPDPVTAAAARLVLEQVVAHVPARWHAPPLTLLALLAWWHGDGGLAGHRVRGAQAEEPAYRLAALLNGVLAAAVPPGWVRAGASAVAASS